MRNLEGIRGPLQAPAHCPHPWGPMEREGGAQPWQGKEGGSACIAR